MDDYLQTANLALEEWHKKCRDLQQEKESLLKEMDEAKEKRDTEIDSLLFIYNNFICLNNKIIIIII